MALFGALFLVMALASTWVRQAPITSSVIYLAVGVALGPGAGGLVAIDLIDAAPWLEHLAELAVILSLFVGGLRLRLPLRDPAWRAAFVLAGPVMLLSIGGVALVVHLALGLELATALLVGAVLAPTDPVLSGAVTVGDAADCDRMRYGVSGEAGLNDGMAFPFVVFALLLAEHGRVDGWVGTWVLERLVWAVPAGLLIGWLLGRGVGIAAVWLRARQRDTEAPSDFLALALIALSYVLADGVGAWGFLAVFAAGVGLRHAEVRVVERAPAHVVAESDEPHPPAEALVMHRHDPEQLDEPAVAAGVLVAETLSFGDTLERLMEVLLVMLVGITIVDHWHPGGLLVAGALFFVVRPLATVACLTVTPTSGIQRWMMGWFGIRGIGSIYYLMYAITHGLDARTAEIATGLTMTVVAVSIVAHGVSAQPILNAYEARLERDAKSRR